MLKFITFILLLLSFTVQANCQRGGVKVSNDFANATSDALIASCEINLALDKITITLQPENTPINNSPWYAFKLTSDKNRQVTVTLRFNDGTPRYQPKISHDGKNWQTINYKQTDKFLRVTLSLTNQPLWLAGQELISNLDYINWGTSLAEKRNIIHAVIGESVQHRPLYKIESYHPKVKQWLVILGRQHPPEITGALALFPFTSAVLSDSELAKVFRSQFNILVIPNMNPDGVDLGYWRHNANGADLNRDWKAFKQPEVRAVDSLLTTITERGEHIAMAVDFHSTHKDIFYTMPDDYGVKQPLLVTNWLNKLDQLHPDFKVIQQPGNNPNKGVFKQYIADKFKVHAITYEMGDHTNRQFIRELAIDAANTLMKTMLINSQKNQKNK